MSFDLGGILNIASGGTLVDGVGEALGLPKPVRDLAKIAFGAATGNPLALISGVAGLVEDLSSTAKTEWKPRQGGASDGYADEPAGGTAPFASAGAAPAASAATYYSRGQDPGEADFYRNAAVLRDHFRQLETEGFPIPDNVASPYDFILASNDPNASPELRDAAQYFLSNPDQRVRLGLGYRRPSDGIAPFTIGMLDRAVEEGQQRGYGTVHGSGPAAQPGNAGGSPPPGAPSNPSGTPPAHSGTTTPPGAPPPSTPPAGASSSGGSQISDILNDPNLSPEEKIEAIMESLVSSADDDLLDTAKQLDQARVDGSKIDASSDAGKEQAAKSQNNIDALTRRLQSIVQRRTEMMGMLTNISQTFHESAMRCISNIR